MDLKHFVTFFYKSANGLFEDTHSLKSDKLTSLRIPARALGFKLFDRPNDDIILNGEKVVSKHTDINEKLYYIGRLISIDEIKKKFGEDSDAYNEITRNNFYGAVLTRENVLMPLRLNESVHILPPIDVRITPPSQVEEQTASEL